MADLKVNEIIIKRINEKYKNVKWDILSEENVKFSPKKFKVTLIGFGFLILLMEQKISSKEQVTMHAFGIELLNKTIYWVCFDSRKRSIMDYRWRKDMV